MKELKNLDDIDLFIFCEEMYAEFDQASLSALQRFGDMLNENGWKCCIVALTKANLFPLSMKGINDKKARIKELKETMKEEMQKRYFFQRGFCEISENIPFVPLGAKTEDADERENRAVKIRYRISSNSVSFSTKHNRFPFWSRL